MSVRQFGTFTWGFPIPGEPSGSTPGPIPGTMVFSLVDTDGQTDREHFYVDGTLVTGLEQNTAFFARSSGVSSDEVDVLPAGARINGVSFVYGPGTTLGDGTPRASRLFTDDTLRAATVKMDGGKPGVVTKDHGLLLAGPFPADADTGGSEQFPITVTPIATDSAGNPWTVAELFNEIFCVVVPQFGHGSFIRVGTASIEVDFTLPPLSIFTSAATLIDNLGARLNASGDFSGATSAYPIHVDFLVSTSPTLEDDVAPTPGVDVTEPTDQLVGEVVSNLLTNTTYYFKARATQDGVVTTADNIESFTTTLSTSIMGVY